MSDQNPQPSSQENPTSEEKKADATPEAPKEQKPQLPPTPIELLPKQQVEILQLTKTGAITLPKEIRETLPEKVMFAFWKDMNRFVFQPVAEADIPNLNLGQESKEKEKGTEKKGKKKAESGEKSPRKTAEPIGPQPEPAKYLIYEFENKEKVAQTLESAFWKFVEKPPNIEEGLGRIKFALMSFAGKGSTNDSRLRNTIILFLCDVAEKVNIPEVLTFAEEKVIPNISSKFLLEQSLITLTNTTLQIKNYTKAKIFLRRLFDSIELYPDSQIFDIKDSFKNFIKTVLRTKVEISNEIKQDIYEEFKKFSVGFQVSPKKPEDKPLIHQAFNPGSSLELIDHLEKLKMIEEARNLAEMLLKSLPADAKEINDIRAKIHSLSPKSTQSED